MSVDRRLLMRWHVWLGWLIGVPLVLWTVTGLVMVARPIDVVRGTDLRAQLPPLSPIAAIAPQLAPGQAESLTLRQTALGPRWILAGRDESRAALDPRSGLALPPLTQAQATSAAHAYRKDNARIEAVAFTPRDRPPFDLRQPRPVWGVTFADNARFYIDAETGELIAVRTRWWRVFDFMWGLHIMDLQTREDTHHPILILFAALAAAGSVLGCVLMIRKYSRPRVRG